MSNETKPTTAEEKFYPIRLTYLRMMSRMTETELARECQCSKQAISHYEKGVRTPKEPVILMFCQVFGVSRDVFFEYTFKITAIGNKFLINPRPNGLR